MARTVAPGVHRIRECGPDRSEDGDLAVHVPQHAYLVRGERSLLFDTLSPASTDHVLAELDALLDDGLDYLAPSHPDVPHAGNTAAILDAYPEAELLAPRYGTGHDLYHLGDATSVGEGDEFDLGGPTVAFHEAPFPDAAVHVWMSERVSGTLFTVDWLGFPHLGDECDLFVEEFEREVGADRLVSLHEFVLFWLEYVDVDAVHAEIERVRERHDPEVIAPAHGNPIRESPGRYLDRMKTVTERIAARRDGGAEP